MILHPVWHGKDGGRRYRRRLSTSPRNVPLFATQANEYVHSSRSIISGRDTMRVAFGPRAYPALFSRCALSFPMPCVLCCSNMCRVQTAQRVQKTERWTPMITMLVYELNSWRRKVRGKPPPRSVLPCRRRDVCAVWLVDCTFDVAVCI